MGGWISIIIAAAVAIAIIIYGILLSKKLNGAVRDVTVSEVEERRGSMKVSRVSSFIPYKYRAFYEVLKSAMPSNYIILPNTAVELLFQRENRKELHLEGQYASFCVFTSELKPVLVIQLKDYSEQTDLVFEISDSIKNLIRGVGIPVMDQEIRDQYSIDGLRRAIAKTMNPLYTEGSNTKK